MASRNLKIGIIGASLLAVAMLLYGLLGRPPYAFFGLLRCAVAFACGLAAWSLFDVSKRYLPVCLVLALLAGVFLVGKMHRADWAFFDWCATACLLVAVMVQGLSIRRSPYG